MKSLVPLLIVAVVGLCDGGLHAQDAQSLGAVGISRAERHGITITRVIPGGSAQRAGLAVGDVITAIDGKPVKQADEEAELLSSRPAGSFLRISYVRGTQSAEVPLVLGSDQQGIQLAASARVHVSQSEAVLIHRVAPTYPALAREARIQGTVALEAVISETGRVESLQAVSGHPVLTPAAIEAVKQWQYKPYYLNGKPVEIEMQVLVSFTLASDQQVAGQTATAQMGQSSSGEQPSFKGHRIGESTTEFLSVESSLKAKVVDCQATAPRALTADEIKRRYGRKRYEQYEKQEAERNKQGKHTEVMDKDPDVYGDKCGALLDALVNGKGHIYGNGYEPHNVYAQNLSRRSYSDPRGDPLPQIEVSDGRQFYFDDGALSALHLDIAADYGSVRDDVTSRLGVAPEEVAVPYQNAFGATWKDITCAWDTKELHVELFQSGNPAKPSLPHLSVRSKAVYKEALEREKLEPKPLDR